MQRHGLAFLAVLFALLGIVVLFTSPDSASATMWGASSTRIALLLGALWVAYPHLQRLPSSIWVIVLILCVVIARRPLAVPLAAAILIAIALLRRKSDRSIE